MPDSSVNDDVTILDDRRVIGLNFNRHHRSDRSDNVPVTVIRRSSDQPIIDIHSARQVIRSQAASRERLEQLLRETQTRFRDLHTRFSTERAFKDETIRNLEAERTANLESIEDFRKKLIAERAIRHEVEDRLAQILKEQETKRTPQLTVARPRTMIPKAPKPPRQPKVREPKPVKWWK